ncbi:MAG: YIEGIA family protein [Syntrophaceticus sp.]|nr:YIEGIA family protein [Syntrophaceticus sp.]MDD3314421.1 YIEGIA family protein [Syntrophaceticus sp.]MDD4359666.1 YIEGIA family protein [Syntrophaceticus sp.]MDD4782929.1 YIEGIA family protein [Syntrophaceticus sp.]
MLYQNAIVSGLVAGVLARLFMLRLDYRQYPTYPHDLITHIALGAIAALIGAVFIPALLLKEFTAVTFLTIAAEQFRHVRNMERETLLKLEENELVQRGVDYVEGIARTFEARNYLTIFTAIIASGLTIWIGWLYATAATIIIIILSQFLKTGQVVGEIAEVVAAKLHFKGPLLMVDDIVIMNVGYPPSQEKILAEGMAVMIKPKDDNGRAILHSVGQRQAILHTAAALLGTKLEIAEPDFTPLARKDIDTGAIGLFILPLEKDFECLRNIIERSPVLESASRKPLETQAGRIASD